MASKTDFKNTNPRSRIEWLAAWVIFILPLIGITVSGKNLSRWMTSILLVFFFGSMICAVVLAVIRVCLVGRFPIWDLALLSSFFMVSYGVYGACCFINPGC